MLQRVFGKRTSGLMPPSGAPIPASRHRVETKIACPRRRAELPRAARRGLARTVALFVVAGLALGACQADGKFEGVEPFVCVSGKIWTYEDKDSPLMNPGRSCIGCHVANNDPGQ